jgi:phosphatidylglycerol:prolipoprotein diacylglycerol transferase
MHPVLIISPHLGVTVYAYQTCLALAVVIGIVLATFWASRLEAQRPWRALGASIILAGVILGGARVHYLLARWHQLATDPFAPLHVGSGLHAPGGVIGLLVFAPLVFRLFDLDGWKFADVCAPTGGVVMGIVRVGCFLNGCCVGVPCDWPWCVTFPRTAYLFLLHAQARLVGPQDARTAPVHPLQLYFAAVGLAIAAAALLLYRRKRFDGQIGLGALVAFSASSAVLELFRADYPERVYWAGVPQLLWVTAAMSAAAAAWLAVAGRRAASRRSAVVRNASQNAEVLG